MEVEVDGLLGSSVAADADAMVAGAMMTKAQIQTKQLQLAIIRAKDQSTSKPLWPYHRRSGCPGTHLGLRPRRRAPVCLHHPAGRPRHLAETVLHTWQRSSQISRLFLQWPPRGFHKFIASSPTT